MGRQEVVTDATALTPSLYLGHYLSLFHFKLGLSVDVPVAVGHIRAGGVVLTDSSYLAILVLAELGVPTDTIMDKLHWATHVRPVDADLSI